MILGRISHADLISPDPREPPLFLKNMTEYDTENDESHPPTVEAQFQQLEQILSEVDPDTRLAMEKLICWMAERPNGAASISKDQMEKMFEEIRLENIRRRLGGKVGEVLPFRKPGAKG